jgi:Putative bacterial sensory transduction regulator
MKKRERTKLIESTLRVLFENGKDGAFVTFENADSPDEYVQLGLDEHGLANLEVGSREWVEPFRPLPAEAVDRLEVLACGGGGREVNYSRRGVAPDPRACAELTDALFTAAYGNTRGLDLVPATTVDALADWLRTSGVWQRNIDPLGAPPGSRPISRSRIRGVLRERHLPVMTDPDGDLFTWWSWTPEVGCEVKAWFSLAGELDTRIFTMMAVPDRPVFNEDRAEMVRLINEWHCKRRWPMCYLRWNPETETGMIHAQYDLPLGAPVADKLIADAIEVFITGAHDFFAFLQENRSVPTLGIAGADADRAAS